MLPYFMKVVAGGGDGRCRSTMAPVPWPLVVCLHRGGWIALRCCQSATWGACGLVPVMVCAAPRRRRDGVLLPEGCRRWGWSLPLHLGTSSVAVGGVSASWWMDSRSCCLDETRGACDLVPVMVCAAPRRRRDGVLLPEGCRRWGWSLPLHLGTSSVAVGGVSASWWVDCPLLLSGCNQGRVWPCSVMVSGLMKFAADGDGRCCYTMAPVPWPLVACLHLGGCVARRCCQNATWGACGLVWGWSALHLGGGVMVSCFLKVAGGGDGRCRSTMAPVPWPLVVCLLLGGWIVRCCCQDATRGACVPGR